MNVKSIICCVIVLIGSIQLSQTSQEKSAHSNEILPKEAIRNLAPSVRLALLRAIDKLEKEAAEEEEDDDDDDDDDDISVEENHSTSESKDEILEESTPSNVKPTVKFYTAAADDELTKPEPLSIFIEKTKKKFVKAGSPNYGQPNIVDQGEKHQDTYQSARSINSDKANEISSDSNEEVQFHITNPKIKTSAKRKPSTTTSTTTTTQRPTHNDDGENIEVVSKQDVKIFEAPLVTAFTVQQDDKGIASRVIPILNEASTTQKTYQTNQFISGPTIEQFKVVSTPTSSNLEKLSTPLATQSSLRTISVNNELAKRLPIPLVLKTDVPPQKQQSPPFASIQQSNSFIPSTEIPIQSQQVNNFLLERQRQLEHQIQILQLQARQQQEQISQQLKLLEEQRQRESQFHVHSQVQTTQSTAIPSSQPTQILPNTQLPPQANTQTTTKVNSNVNFTIRPSIELNQNSPQVTQSPNQFQFATGQQLPVKDATDFRSGFINGFFKTQQNNQRPSTVQIQPSQQFSYVPHTNQLLPQFVQPLELSSFQNLPQRNFQIYNPPQQLLPLEFSPLLNNGRQNQHQQQQHQTQNTRQYRQETGTSNFGHNQQFTQQNQNFFRQFSQNSNNNNNNNNNNSSNFGFHRSGTSSFNSINNNKEELNIISKVLALNHGINPYTPQNLRYPGQQSIF